MQNVADSKQLMFLLRKKELSSGVVALFCLVSLTEFTCELSPRDKAEQSSTV